MINNWKKPFFLAMEKQAIVGALVMGAMNAASTVSDIKLNKAKMKLEPPGGKNTIGGSDPYTHQFASTSSQTPNRSLFG